MNSATAGSAVTGCSLVVVTGKDTSAASELADPPPYETDVLDDAGGVGGLVSNQAASFDGVLRVAPGVVLDTQ